MLRGYLCMTHPLNLPNMVKQVLLEGQRWSPDHPASLPLALILAWDLELEEPKIYEACSDNVYFTKLNWKNKKKTFGNPAKTVTIVGTGKSNDFYIFVKVGYYPLLPLACTSIEASLKLLHWLLLCVVYCYTLTWLELNLIKLFFFWH